MNIDIATHNNLNPGKTNAEKEVSALNEKKLSSPVKGKFEDSLKNNKMKEEMDRLRKVSQEFEGILLQQMMKSMRNSVMKSDLMGNRNAEDMFQSMLDDEYTKKTAAQEKYGLASKIFEQLKKSIVE